MFASSSLPEGFQVSAVIRYEAGLASSQAPRDRIVDKFTTMNDFYLLRLHQEKIMNAGKQLNWSNEVIERYSGDRGLQVIFAMLLLHVHDDVRINVIPLQIHLALAKDGRFDISSSPALQPGLLFPTDLSDKKPNPTLEVLGVSFQRSPIRVLIDEQATPFSGDLESSTSPNPSFDNLSSTEETLVVNKYGEVLQGKSMTPFFQRDGVWTTPAFSGVPADSVTRRYALEHGLCKEGIILKSSLMHGEPCWLSDGVRGLCRGAIHIFEFHTDKDSSKVDPKAQRPHSRHESEQKLSESLRSRLPKHDREDNDHDNGKDKDKDNKLPTIPSPGQSGARSKAPKRPNPFASPSPPTRRSKRGRPGFTATYLTDEDETHHRTDHKSIPNPEHRGVLHRRRSPRPYSGRPGSFEGK